MALSGIQEETGSYALGRFCKDDHAFESLEFNKPSPFGSRIASPETDYTVLVAPDGSGFSFLGDMALTSGDESGKQWSIRDRETNSVWMPFAYLSEDDHDEYSVRYLPGSVTIRSVNGKIASTLTICASPTDTCELWRICIQNLSAKERALAFDVCVSPYITATGRISVSESGKTIALGQDRDTGRAGLNNGVIFLGSTVKPSYYHTCSSDFFSVTGSISGTVTSNIEDNPILGISLEMEIPIEGEAVFGFCFGVADTFENAMATVECHQGTEWIEHAAHQTNKEWKSICSLVKCESNDTAFDALVDTWLPYELLTEWLSARKVQDAFSTVGVVDIVRLAAPFSLELSLGVRDAVLEMAGKMVSAGLYSSDGLSMTAMVPDETLWLPYATADYVVETGDTSILDVPMHHLDVQSYTLRDVCVRELCYYLEERKKAALPRHPACKMPIAVFQPSVSSDEYEKNEHNTFNWCDNKSELIRYIFNNSETLTASMDQISKWFSLNVDEENHGLLLCLYLAITRDILGLHTTESGIEYNPKLPVCTDVKIVSRKMKSEVVSFKLGQTNQHVPTILSNPH